MDNKKDWGIISAWILLALGFISIFLPYYKLDGIEIFGGRLNTSKYNDLGTFVGGISTPILSVSAFILLYLTYKSQKEELRESRLLLTQQTASIKKQQFENTFFNLLNQHNTIVNSIDIVKRERKNIMGGATTKEKYEFDIVTIHGRDCFKFFYKQLTIDYKNVTQYYDLERIESAYDGFFQEYQNDVSHYFRFLYNMIKVVDNSDIADKKTYTNIVRAQLSSHELLLLFYNCLTTGYGRELFKPLIEKYQLLKNMPFSNLLEAKHKTFYKASAYDKPVIE
jgi:hypothetical protein